MSLEKGFFQWDQKYALDVNQMDNEHKQLITYMNQLHELHDKKADFHLIEFKLNELFKYTEKHFKNEEVYFTSIPYEKAKAHMTIHKDLIAKLTDHATKIKAQKKITDEFFTFLKVWLSAHILGLDKGYSVVKKNGAA